MSSSSDSSFCNLDKFDKKWSVKSILQDHFETYLKSHTPRLVELKEVNKALTCYEDKRGVFVYMCPKCNFTHKVKIGCNSRICSSCGKRYADAWSSSLSRYLFKVPHRHVVIGIPDILWSWLKNHRCFWKDYMDCAILTLNDIFSQMLKQDIQVGAIVVLHPFGKDINFKPHLHLIITEGGFNVDQVFVKDNFIPAETFRKKWQYHVLKVLQNCGLPNALASQCYLKYKKGFYVWIDKAGRIKNSKTISQYIGRYIRHPAVANSRIVKYEGGYVTFYYKNPTDDEKIIYVTKPVDEFIEAILQHIPEPQFKMIRYYGAYSRRNVSKYKKSLKQSSIEIKTFNKILKKEQVLCPNCECEMELVGFCKYKPP